MAKQSILVIDDEEDILELVEYNLNKAGYKVVCANSSKTGLEIARKNPPDLVILDLMLPDIDGLEVCKILKGNPQTRDIPIIMLTAKGEETDIVVGLELGADDYMVKPFSPRVLSSRVKSVLRRNKKTVDGAAALIKIRDLVINIPRHEVQIDEKAVDLTATEFKLLVFLVQNKGFVFTRDQIVDVVHGEDYPVTNRSVDVQVVGLRRKLRAYGMYIETVRGVGYRFTDN